MEIIHLKYFLEVARHKSFSKAAIASHVSQSVISKLVKDLEQELGTTLFSRNSKQVMLTDAGDAFFPEADRVVALFNNLVGDLKSKFRIPQGKIRVGLPLMTDAATFAHLLRDFRQKYPEIETELYEYGTKKIEAAIQEGNLDLGIICRPPLDPEFFDSFSFSFDLLKVVVHPDHPLSQSDKISLAALSQEPFILSTNDFSLHDEIIMRCNQVGFHPKIMLETSQRELMVQAVAANLGITLIPSKICQGLSPTLVRTIPLIEPEIIHCMSVIWKRSRPLSFPAKLYLEFAKGYLL